MAQLHNQDNLESTDIYMPNEETAPSPELKSTVSKKKLLGISAATVLLGGAIGLTIANAGEPSPPDSENPPIPTEPATGRLPQDIDIAGKVTDDMSFEQAFAAARDEVGEVGVFNWHGLWYNTFKEEEWSGLSLEQRQEFVEAITGEKLPVIPYSPTQINQVSTVDTTVTQQPQPEPTVIEGYLNGHRVMGLDFNQDGVIDTLVMDGQDGSTYRVVDATGDDGLDTVYQYNTLDGKLTAVTSLDAPFVLSNENFSQHLENSMSQEVVDSILESDEPTAPTMVADDMLEAPEEDPDEHIADSNEPDDTYVNNGDVRDMDE